MNSTKKRRIILLQIIIYFLCFGLPLLVWMFGGCTFDGAALLPSSCAIPLKVFKDYASFVYAMLVISSYLLGIPLLIYIAIVVGMTELIAWALKG
jgi:hypothetical protein